MIEPVQMDREAFLQGLLEYFPEIYAGIDDISCGLLHPEMGVAADATRAAIGLRNWGTVKAHFQFIDMVFASGDDAVRNAVYVSYLENVLLGETAQEFIEARSMLSPALIGALAELEAHFQNIFASTAITANCR